MISNHKAMILIWLTSFKACSYLLLYTKNHEVKCYFIHSLGLLQGSSNKSQLFFSRRWLGFSSTCNWIACRWRLEWWVVCFQIPMHDSHLPTNGGDSKNNTYEASATAPKPRIWPETIGGVGSTTGTVIGLHLCSCVFLFVIVVYP